MLSRFRLLMIASLFGLLVPVFSVGVASADDAVVGSGSPGSCTEAAFDAALATAHLNGGGTITFNCGPGSRTILFTTDKVISGPANIVINGGGKITLDGGNAVRHFYVAGGARLEIRFLKLTNGNPDNSARFTSFGGAVFVEIQGALSAVNTTFQGNNASFEGGAVDVRGVATITNSTFENNSAGNNGGAAKSASSGQLTITGSTFVGNSTGGRGGAALSGGSSQMTISNSTFSGNTADSQAALAAINSSTTYVHASTVTANVSNNGAVGTRDQGSSLTASQTIIADQLVGADCSNALTSNDYNLDSDGSCGFGQANDISSGTADLAPLGNYGGSTRTHPPLMTSDAIDNGGGPNCPFTDQRGVSRPQGASCDIGSVEIIPPVEIDEVCASAWTGGASYFFFGACNPAFQMTIDVADGTTDYFCVNSYTNAVRYSPSGVCSPIESLRTTPVIEPWYLCVNNYTTFLRSVPDVAYCAYGFETPVVIEANDPE